MEGIYCYVDDVLVFGELYRQVHTVDLRENFLRVTQLLLADLSQGHPIIPHLSQDDLPRLRLMQHF